MDGDGQDDPNQLIDLIEKSINEPKIAITVNRSKREEDFTFKILYQLYLVLTFLLTFKYLKFGVFSYLHYSSIDRILSTEDVYMAYVAGFAKHFKNKNTIYAARKKRITGKSQNNYRSLIYYALKIISVFRYQALINATVISFAGYLLTGFTIYSLIFVFALFAFIIIIFLIPHRVDKFFIKNSLSNIKNIENLNN